VSDVEARLRRIEDERAVLDALHRYGQGVTFKDRTLWLSAFAADATLTMRYWPDLQLAVDLRGHGQLAAWFDEHERQWPVGSEAQLTINARVAVDATGRANSVCSFVVLMRSDEGAPSLRTIGRYDDSFVRDDDGVWRIADRQVVTSTRRRRAVAA
jgi:3-phenylpropionate/cinnamic acid dioxygenase small subunit